MAFLDDNWQNLLKSARSLTEQEYKANPSEIPLQSVLSQLDYLIALEAGVESDQSALQEINMGYLAVYPLADVISNELSTQLCDISQSVKRELRKRSIVTRSK